MIWHWLLIDWHWAYIALGILVFLSIVIPTTKAGYWDGFLDALMIDSWFW